MDHCQDCLPACNTTSYVTDIQKFEMNDTILLDLRFKDLSYEKISESAQYPASSLLGDIGGQLGMFTGASLLTLVEFFDLVILFWCRKVGKQLWKCMRKSRNEERYDDKMNEI